MYEFLKIIIGLSQFFGFIIFIIGCYYAIVIIAKVLSITYKSFKSWMQD